MERREYACGKCGAIYMGYFNPDSENRYEPCPECGATMADQPLKINTTDSTSWLWTRHEVETSLKSRGKNMHFLSETYLEKELEYYRKKGLIQ